MRWITWPGIEGYRNIGLAIVRIGLGAMMMAVHGWPKVKAGEAKWASLGQAMGALGIDVYPVFWGAAAAFTEFFGGFLIILGLGTRPVAALMGFTLFVAATNELATGRGLFGASHAIETGLAFAALFFAGPGDFSIDRRLQR